MNELDRLFAAWQSGPLNADDAQLLHALLQDPQQRRRWRALADLDGALAERGAAVLAEPAQASPVSTRRMRQQRPRRQQRASWIGAAASALAACLCLAWWWRVADAANLPTCGKHTLARGSTIQGPATILWPDGSEAVLATDGQATVPATGHGLDLNLGDLSVHATLQMDGAPFQVRTPHAVATVLGTRFSLRTSRTSTSLIVDEGRVAFQPVNGLQREVTAGEHTLAGPPEPIALGLVGWWSLNEGHGTIAHDASGHRYDGVITGPQWTDRGLHFRGGNDGIDVAPQGLLATIHEGDYTLTAWFMPEELPKNTTRDSMAVIVGRTGWTLGLHLDHDGRYFMQHFLTDCQPRAADAPPNATLNQWIHLVGIVDRVHGITRLAINGSLIDSAASWTPGAAPFAYQNDQHWRIGIGQPHADVCRWPACGLIRDVRIYARALDRHELIHLSAKR